MTTIADSFADPVHFNEELAVLGDPASPMTDTHARIGKLLHDAREVINEMIALRLDPVGECLIEQEEGEITALRNSLNFLLTDIKLARDVIEAQAELARLQVKPALRIV